MRTYELLMDAEERLEPIRRRLGIDPPLDEALEAREPDDDSAEPHEDLYLDVLADMVAALGGHVEVQAVFPQETITVRRLDGDPPPPTRP
jgi:hypothetical protein